MFRVVGHKEASDDVRGLTKRTSWPIRGLKRAVNVAEREHMATMLVLFVLFCLGGMLLLLGMQGTGDLLPPPVYTTNKSTLNISHSGATSFFAPHTADGNIRFHFPTAPFFSESVVEYKKRVRDRMDYAESKAMEGTIFISVPSYRDSLCSTTLRLIFEMAEQPERVFVGLCDQLDESHDTPCAPPPQYTNQVRTVRMPYTSSRGPTLARYVISKLWDGEEFLFMIDAHTNFIPKWDSVLVRMMRKHPPKTVLTHYPVGETALLGDNRANHLPWLCKSKFGRGAPKNLMLQECEDCRIANRPGNLTCPSVFIAAGFSFAGSRLMLDAPFDRYLDWFFQGEELLIAARLWTAGWNFFNPTTNVISHVYGYRNHSFSVEAKAKRDDRPAVERAHFLLGVSQQRPKQDAELENLGMGTERTLEEYLDFAGLDLVHEKHETRCDKRYDWATKRWIKVR